MNDRALFSPSYAIVIWRGSRSVPFAHVIFEKSTVVSHLSSSPVASSFSVTVITCVLAFASAKTLSPVCSLLRLGNPKADEGEKSTTNSISVRQSARCRCWAI